MEDFMKVTSTAIWDEAKQAWRVHTEYTANNFQPDKPLVGEYYVRACNCFVLPFAISATLGIDCELEADEIVEEIT
jgi:hypothetical protein